MAEDIDKLIEWLEDMKAWCAREAYDEDAAACDETIAALRTQQARISELEAERDAAVLAEREACATLVEDEGSCRHVDHVQGFCACADKADAIRARSNTDTGPQAQVRAETSVLVAPDGWQLVPKEPAWEVLIDHGLDSDTWAALLAALPTPPAAEAVGGGGLVLLPKEATHSMAAYARHRNPGISIGLAMGIWSCMSDQALLEMQRERGDVAGQDGLGGNCALKGTGPAATLSESETVPTASEDLVEEVARVIEAAEREYSLTAGIDDPDKFIARAALSSPPVREIVGALNDALGMFKCTQRIDSYQPDHWSRRARSILSRFQSVGGEKHDHADGTSAEAVEKVTQVDERRQ